MTLEEKLALPYTKFDCANGLNFHEREDPTWIRHDADQTEGLDICCDWNNLPLPDKSIDEMHFSDAIEHCRPWDYDKTFGEFNRIMKEGGIFFGTTPNRTYIIKAAYNNLQDEEWIQRNLYGHSMGYGHTHYTTFTKESLKELLEKYGFGEVEFKPIEQWIHWTCKKVRDL